MNISNNWICVITLALSITMAGCKKKSDKMLEQAVTFYGNLSDNEFGTFEEREAVFSLEDKLIDKIKNMQAGEYDGHEFGGGEFILYMYSIDANALYSTIEPLLRESDLTKGGYVIIRRGPPGAKEKRIVY